MTAAFLAVSSFASFAPLNQDFRAQEYTFYLADLKPKALIVRAGANGQAVRVAESRSIPIIDLLFDEQTEAGRFELKPRGRQLNFGPPQRDRSSKIDDEALVLHTSGTTSRQKVVSLKHRNILASANGYKEGMGLSHRDRSLCMMPLFHTHGLITATLSTLMAGGSVVCTPGFMETHYFDWLSECKPTWYPAVSTIHRAVLSCVEADPSLIEIIKNSRIRILFSGSAPLSPQVAEKLEGLFGVPIIEGYGMTEVTNLICSNPLPPKKRRLGSVGLPAVPKVKVMSERGEPLSSGQVGEVVIGGDLVESSFDSDTKANPEFFFNGWFRTGDQGYFDEDGYLYLTGRLKELINRGGEKISPLEVDEVLLEHPAVAQVITFPIPHNQLGEDVAAAIVLHQGTAANAQEIVKFAAQNLADFKVPRRIIFLEELPKGPTGKLKRIGLAETLGLRGAESIATARYREPQNDLEQELVAIWKEALGVECIGVDDNFIELGGDSFRATRLISRVRDKFQLEVPMQALLKALTIAEMAKAIISHKANQIGPDELEHILDEVEGSSGND
jgi:acyl-CoA synthetase (AMP-forming)/AMP-acid ligase II/acyl carrier protein